MTIAEFKAQFGVSKLDFFTSKSNPGRKVASFQHNQKEIKLITKDDFDSTKPAYVYLNNILVDKDTAEVISNLYWVTNSVGEAAFSL